MSKAVSVDRLEEHWGYKSSCRGSIWSLRFVHLAIALLVSLN
jgi:hypothetical protein